MQAKHAVQPWEMILISSSVGIAVGRYADWSAAIDWDVQVFVFLVTLLFVLCLCFAYICARVALSMFIAHCKGE
jgi:hypothetical protein